MDVTGLLWRQSERRWVAGHLQPEVSLGERQDDLQSLDADTQLTGTEQPLFCCLPGYRNSFFVYILLHKQTVGTLLGAGVIFPFVCEECNVSRIQFLKKSQCTHVLASWLVFTLGHI